MYFVYVLRNAKGKLYKGLTNNLDRRLREHQELKGNWTSKNGPFQLVYFEEFNLKEEAQKREKFFKSGKGREFLKNLITRKIEV